MLNQFKAICESPNESYSTGLGISIARTAKERLPKNSHVSAFIVPMDSPGVSVGTTDKKMGQAGSTIADIILEEVHVPDEALLGGELGKGFVYATERKAFGEPIANFQLIQQMLAQSEIDIYAAECMMADVTARAISPSTTPSVSSAMRASIASTKEQRRSCNCRLPCTCCARLMGALGNDPRRVEPTCMTC